MGTRVRLAVSAAVRAHGWFDRHSAVGSHSTGCLPSSPVYGYGLGAGSLIGALRCSRETALRTTLFHLSTTLVLISIRLST